MDRLGLHTGLALFTAVAASLVFTQTSANRLGAQQILWSPPPIHWPAQLPPPSAPREIVRSLIIGGAHISFEQTELRGIQKRFGGAIGTSGDAGDSIAWLCLHGHGAYGHWILWLTSGEINGLTRIDGFQWSLLEPNQVPDHRCASLAPGLKVELTVPVRLGATQDAAKQILGPPTLAVGGVLYYLHEHEQLLNQERYTTSNSVVITICDGRVWAIEAGQTTTD